MERNKIILGNCLDELKKLPDNSIDCCVTSPPYYALRNYQVDGQIGLEPTLREYIDNMVEICEEIRRVLKPTGTFWLNIGDTYSNHKDDKTTKQTISKREGVHEIEKGQSHSRNSKSLKEQGFKNKELMGVPWRLAFALSDAGWYLRQDIIWAKATSGQERNGNCMPESVTDRMTKGHEYIFLLTKNDKYYFDNYAVKESLSINTYSREARQFISNKLAEVNKNFNNRSKDYLDHGLGNMRSVWRINLQPGSSGQHIAGYPEKIPYYCIKAGSSEKGCCANCGKPYVRILNSEKIRRSDLPKNNSNYRPNNYNGKYLNINGKGDAGFNKTIAIGWKKSCNCETNEIVPSIILDPFMGSGTTAKVALQLERDFIGFELNEDYLKFAQERIKPYLFKGRFF